MTKGFLGCCVAINWDQLNLHISVLISEVCLQTSNILEDRHLSYAIVIYVTMSCMRNYLKLAYLYNDVVNYIRQNNRMRHVASCKSALSMSFGATEGPRGFHWDAALAMKNYFYCFNYYCFYCTTKIRVALKLHARMSQKL